MQKLFIKLISLFLSSNLTYASQKEISSTKKQEDRARVGIIKQEEKKEAEDLSKTIWVKQKAKELRPEDNPDKAFAILEKLIEKRGEKRKQILDKIRLKLENNAMSAQEKEALEEHYAFSTTEELYKSAMQSVSQKMVKDKQPLDLQKLRSELEKEMNPLLEKEKQEKIRIQTTAVIDTVIEDLMSEFVEVKAATAEVVDKRPDIIIPEAKKLIVEQKVNKEINKNEDIKEESEDESSVEQKSSCILL